MARQKHSTIAWLVGIILSAILLKVGLLIAGSFPFNSDEAIVALMARHILSGERPIFFYGQAYMGSLDAYLVAAFFAVLGQSVWIIRLVQSLLFSLTVISTYLLGKAVFKTDKAGLLAAAFVAFPSVNLTLYTTISLGGYGEALCLGNLILLAALWLVHSTEKKEVPAQAPRLSNGFKLLVRTWFPVFMFGFFIGLGLWTNGLTLIYSVPAIIYVILRYRRLIFVRQPGASGKVAVWVAGFAAGMLPLLNYLIVNGLGKLLNEYLGSAVAIETGSGLVRAWNHLLNFTLLGSTAFFGFRPPWTVTWLVLPLIPFILIFWMWTIIVMIKWIIAKKEAWNEILLLAGVAAVLIIGFVLTPFGIDPSGRYFLPFGITLALAAAGCISTLEGKSRRWQDGLAAFLLMFYLAGNLQCAISTPKSFTTQFDATTIIDHRYDAQLIQFLRDNHEMRGYSNYWIAYPLAFLSQEDLIFTPRLPYHQDFRYTPRDDRYAPYDAMVAASSQVALITAHFQALDELIREKLAQQDISWKEQVIGDYRVFYDLSKPVKPEVFNFDRPAG